MKIYSIKSFSVTILLFITIQVNSQKPILIIDRETDMPIAGVNYRLGNQKGESNREGKIFITLNSKDDLLLTHISYNTFRLSPVELKSAMEQGYVQLIPADGALLSPVVLFSLKGRALKEKVRLSNGEWVQHDAGQVLQQIPGFSAIKKSGGFAFDPTFRGFKADQLNVLTNGALSTLAACPSRMDPPTSQVLISQIEQLEVLKGPHNFRYGPAVGGVINFKTSPPEFIEGHKVFGRINGGFESNGEIYRTEGALGTKSKNMQLSATGSYSKGHDYKDGNDSVMSANFERASVGIHSDFLINKKNVLNLSATRSFAKNVDFPTLMMDLLSDKAWMLQGGYKVNGLGNWITSWHTQGYASFVDHLMGNKFRPGAVNMDANTSAQTKVLGGRMEFAVINSKTELYFGIDKKDEWEDGNREKRMLTGPMAGKTIIDTIWQDSRQTRAGFFADWHYQLSKFRLSVSARIDAVKSDANAPASKFKNQYADLKSTDINPSMSIGFSRQWDSQWFTGLWLGRGVRSASISEKFINSLAIGIDPFEMLGNPQLKPEANHQIDGIVGYKSARSSIQFNGFGSMVTNYISSVKTKIPPVYGGPGVRQYINIDKALLYGFELSWTHKWLPVLLHQFSATYTYGKNNESKKPLPQIAPLDIRLLLEGSVWKNRLIPYSQIRYVAKQDRVADDYGEVKTPEFSVVDLGVRTEFSKKIQISVAVNNLFNKAYREHLSRFIAVGKPLNSPGRNFIIMASYNF
ncbi:MAG TPA: TonB-dependent receptor [Niabella sp.]|jgi:iron complex outermembrane receptor protein|nr:TonB-dependent receptor [Chitinophagaceae bacterium]HRO84922.1 TonB-dependent receptor [Niabella sp.]